MKLQLVFLLSLAAMAASLAADALPPASADVASTTPTLSSPVHVNGDLVGKNWSWRKPSVATRQRVSRVAGTARAAGQIASTFSRAVSASATALADYPQEIQNIVRACGGDPVKLFELVRNEVRFQPYRGFRKGPVLTWETKSGNDADQAALLVTLLRAAGHEANYVYGMAALPMSAMLAWWGADNTDALGMMTGSAGYFAGNLSDTQYAIEQIWVFVAVDGTGYELLPAYKQMGDTPGIDLTAATGYDRAALLAAAGGTETNTGVLGVSETAVAEYLATRAQALRTTIHDEHPNASVGEIVGERRIVPEPVGSLTEGFPSSWGVLNGFPYFLFDDPNSGYTVDGQDLFFAAGIEVYVGHSNSTGTALNDELVGYNCPLSEFASKQVSVGFTGDGLAQILIDGTVVAQATTAPSGPIGLECIITHPYRDITDYNLDLTRKIEVGGRYAIVVGTGGNDRSDRVERVRAMTEALARQGVPATAPERLDASLELMGLQWLRQRDWSVALTDAIARTWQIRHHSVVIASQTSGISVDIPETSVAIPRDGTTETVRTYRQASIMFGSANEHGVIEQNYPGLGAVSTVRYVRENNLTGAKTYFATAANYSAIAADPLFVAGWSTAWRNYFATQAANGATLIIPQNGAITLGQLTGNGFFLATADQTTASINPGALNGGFSILPVTADGTMDPSIFDPTPGPDNLPELLSKEPINLLNGAYVADQSDLALGGEGARGLNLSRHYSSLAGRDSTGLGHGWSHNFEGRLSVHADTVAAFGGSTPESAVNAIVAAQALLDLSRHSFDTAKGWVVGSLAAYWALEQAKTNTVTASFGRKTFAFTRQADGSYTPSAGVTANLVQDSATGAYRIEERFGSTLAFDAQRRLSSFTDSDGKSLSLAYADSGADAGKLQTVTDCYGRTLTFAYHTDAARAGLLASVTDSTGRTIGYDYTARQLTSVTDPEGHTRTFEYDGVGRLWKYRDECERLVAETLYDAHGAVCTQIAEGDANQTWQYTFTGVLNTETNPLGETTAYRYDRLGRLVAETDGEGHTATHEYDGQNHLVATADALGQRTTFQYDGRHNLRFVTDARSATTEHRYDEFDRLRFTIDPLGKTTEFQYDDEHHLVKTIDPLLRETTIVYHTSGAADGLPWKTIAPNGDTTTTTYDANGHPDTITRADGSVVDVTYNARGDLLDSTTTAVGDPNTHSVTFTYDANRRLLTSTDALGFVTTNTYDEAGNLEAVEDRTGNVASFTYSAWGRKQTSTAPSGAVTRFGYDSAGRSSTVTDALGQVTRFGYDHAGRLTTTTDPLEQVVARTYDAAGRNDSLRNARGKTWLFGFTATGQPETLTTPLSRLTDTAYTLRGQPETVTEPSLQATAFAYFDDARLHTATDAVGTITYGYDANGRLETVVEGGQTITRHYNALGQLDTFTDSAGNAIAYKYDGAGNLTELTYPGSPARTVTYTYDSADRLATVTDWAARVTHFRYDAATSQLSRIELPNGTQRVFTYDSAGRVASVRDEVASGGALVCQFALGYDALDRIVEETTLPEPVPFAVAAASMTYDDDDRLTGWNAFTTASDADGNLTTGPLAGALATFAYDARNRLTSVGNSTFAYDAEGRRVSRTAAGTKTTFVHDPNAALSRLLQSTTGSTTTRYVYAGSLLLYAETGSALRVHHYDYRGSTVALTDATGTVLGRVTYGSYGEIVARTGNTATEFLYNGRDGVVTDPNGLYHMRARYYSPETRRFLNADPIGFAAGTNWYAYVGGCPVIFIDPWGLATIEARPLISNSAKIGAFLTGYKGEHHQIFFEDGNLPPNIGFDDGVGAVEESAGKRKMYNRVLEFRLDDAIMRQAVDNVKATDRWSKDLSVRKNHTCQEFAAECLEEYKKIKEEKEKEEKKACK